MWVDSIEALDLDKVQKTLLKDVQKLTQYFRAIAEHYDFCCLKEAWHGFCPSIFVDAFKPGQRFWLREIVHKDANQVLVYACTYVPMVTFSVFEQVFLNLQQQAIGDAFLYQHRQVDRSAFKFALIDECCEDYKKIKTNLQLDENVIVPARASVFRVEQYPLLIVEYFHPDLRRYYVGKN